MVAFKGTATATVIMPEPPVVKDEQQDDAEAPESPTKERR